MYKSTLELVRLNNFPKNYTTFNEPTKHDILDKIVEFMSDKGSHKVYRHIKYTKWEDHTDKYGFHTPKADEKLRIPMGDQIYYLDIYWQ